MTYSLGHENHHHNTSLHTFTIHHHGYLILAHSCSLIPIYILLIALIGNCPLFLPSWCVNCACSCYCFLFVACTLSATVRESDDDDGGGRCKDGKMPNETIRLPFSIHSPPTHLPHPQSSITDEELVLYYKMLLCCSLLLAIVLTYYRRHEQPVLRALTQKRTLTFVCALASSIPKHPSQSIFFFRWFFCYPIGFSAACALANADVDAAAASAAASSCTCTYLLLRTQCAFNSLLFVYFIFFPFLTCVRFACVLFYIYIYLGKAFVHSRCYGWHFYVTFIVLCDR